MPVKAVSLLDRFGSVRFATSGAVRLGSVLHNAILPLPHTHIYLSRSLALVDFFFSISHVEM